MPRIRRQLPKKIIEDAMRRKTSVSREMHEAHGSPQLVPGKGFIQIVGRPGKKQTIKVWDPNGIRRYHIEKRGIATVQGREQPLNRGHIVTRYDKAGGLLGRKSVKRDRTIPFITTGAEFPGGFAGLHPSEVFVPKPEIIESVKAKKRIPGGYERKKKKRRLPLNE